jgi:hypothetical protein
LILYPQADDNRIKLWVRDRIPEIISYMGIPPEGATRNSNSNRLSLLPTNFSEIIEDTFIQVYGGLQGLAIAKDPI